MSKAGPLVSVIIPTYNRAHRLPVALRSALDQTYDNIEVIVVDDGSTDQTEAIVKSIGDPRVRYIRHDQNRGGAAARNTGLQSSSGEYIAFLDSDDLWLPEKLRRQVELLQELPEQVGMVYGGAEHRSENGEARFIAPAHRGEIFSKLLLRNVVAGSTSCAMIRRSVFERVGGFDVKLPAAHDMDFWLRIARHYHVDFVPECLARIILHEDPVRISNDYRRRIVARERFFDKHQQEMRTHGVAHLYLIETGRIYQHRLMDARASRPYYWQAARENPRYLLSYVLLATTLIPVPVYKKMARLLRQAGSWLGLRRPQPQAGRR